MGKKSQPPPPPPPDYTGLAEKSAASNQYAQTRADWANRPTQITPWGRTDWESEAAVDPSTGQPITRWTQKESLSPEAQKALDDQMALQSGFSEAAKGLMGRATGAFETPFDMSKLPEMTGINQAELGPEEGLNLDLSGLPELAGSGFGSVQEVQDAMMSRMAPDLLRRREGEMQRLRAQGLTEGSEAMNKEREMLMRGENDASQQALLAGMGAYGDIFNRSLAARGQMFGERQTAAEMARALRGQKFGEQVTGANLGGQQRQQAIAEQAYLRSLPLNELNSLLTGQQVQGPQMPGFSTSQSAGGVDYSGAGRNQYQDAMAQYNAAQAAKSKKGAGIGSMVGMIGGGMLGGPLGASLGSSLGGMIGGG